MANNGNYGWDGPHPHVTSVSSSNGAYQVLDFEFQNPGLLDVERAEAHAIKIPELRSQEPPVELLERLDPDYVGTFELVRIVGGEFLDYAIEFTTPRGRMRVHRDVHETWEECLIRVGLLDA